MRNKRKRQQVDKKRDKRAERKQAYKEYKVVNWYERYKPAI